MSSRRLVLFSGESEHIFFVKNVSQKKKKKDPQSPQGAGVQNTSKPRHCHQVRVAGHDGTSGAK